MLMRKSGIPQQKSGIPQPKQWNSALSMRKTALHCGIPQFQLRKKRILRCKKRKSLASENSNYFKNPELQLSENKGSSLGTSKLTHISFSGNIMIFSSKRWVRNRALWPIRAVLWLQSKLMFWVGFLWVYMSHGNRHFHPIQHRYELPAWAARLLMNTFWMNLSLVPQWGFNSTVRSAVWKSQTRIIVTQKPNFYIVWKQVHLVLKMLNQQGTVFQTI